MSTAIIFNNSYSEQSSLLFAKHSGKSQLALIFN